MKTVSIEWTWQFREIKPGKSIALFLL